ncbi:oligopeptide abc transporter, putative [Ricinus communis]|uniref:Oligopeptide abc transporter, putative n=1 Tax=Ricinus communis TaxID=3988 RepID=B9T8J6_RICCO|nr:oligopeptide abc transporter, putative [Ricinus communis]
MASELSRRGFLIQGAALGGSLLLGGGLLTGCQDDKAAVSQRAATRSTTPQYGGRLRMGIIDGSKAGDLDAHKPTTASAIIRGFALYSKLWEWSEHMTPDLALAEEVEVNDDATLWTIRLKKDLEFHHGKTITADDLIFSTRRLSDPELASPYLGYVKWIDRDNLVKLDERTVRIPIRGGTGLLSLPDAWVNFGGIVPVDYHPVTNPVGAGPFKLKDGNHPAAPLKPRVIPIGSQQPLLEVKHLSASYDGKQVLKDVSFQLKKGECLALVGESGSGKTTISRAIAGLNTNAAGGVLFNGLPLALAARGRSAAISHQIQYIFQNPYQSLNPRHTVRQTLLNAVRHYFPDRLKDQGEMIASALKRVALDPAIADRFPKELSGGELQRVSIARALVCEPTLLICDEITSALDVSVQAAILELIKSLQENGLAVIFVTHNLGIVRSISDRVLVLKDGQLVETGDVDTLLDQPRQPYTKALINDSPSIVDL